MANPKMPKSPRAITAAKRSASNGRTAAHIRQQPVAHSTGGNAAANMETNFSGTRAKPRTISAKEGRPISFPIPEARRIIAINALAQRTRRCSIIICRPPPGY